MRPSVSIFLSLCSICIPCIFGSSATTCMAKEKKHQTTPPISNELKFDAEAWRNREDRSRMVNSLIKSKLLIGKTQKEVEELLGAADHLETNFKTFTRLNFTLRNSHYESAQGKNIVYSLNVDIHGGKVVRATLDELRSRPFTPDGPEHLKKYKNN